MEAPTRAAIASETGGRHFMRAGYRRRAREGSRADEGLGFVRRSTRVRTRMGLPDRSSTYASRRDRSWAWLPPTLAVLGVATLLRAFLVPTTMPSRGDPALPFQGNDLTPQYGPWIWNAIQQLWRHGRLAFWDRYIDGGAPQLEVPDAGAVSPEWTVLFIEALTDFTVHQQAPNGYVDETKANWLMGA
ncbi:MAG: hypothetical protein ACHREM_22685, partial [Polyangiales bacterium]